MPPDQIFILSAPIHSGKTTSLMHWATHHTNIYGIFSPVLNGKRVFMNAFTGEQFEMEAFNELDVLLIGKFTFSVKAFERAIAVVRDATKKENGWLVIDEIGPLELQGKGFAPILSSILSDAKVSLQILLVVRDSILNDVIKEFGLDRYSVKLINTDSGLFID